MQVAVIQMTSGQDPVLNFENAKVLIEQAHSEGARLVVLPEMFACIGVLNQVVLAETYFSKDNLECTIGAWAKAYNVYIVAGSVPYVSPHSKKVFSACFVFSPQGKIISQYNKIHLFDVSVDDEKGSYKESNTFLAGEAAVTADIEDQKLGLSICYDLRFPELFQQYQTSGCGLITVPSAFTYQTGKQHWEILLRARAIETQSFILAANQSGTHEDGRKTWGHSMIVSPEGEVLAEVSEEGPGVALANLDFDRLAAFRAAMPLQQHKRLS